MAALNLMPANTLNQVQGMAHVLLVIILVTLIFVLLIFSNRISLPFVRKSVQPEKLESPIQNSTLMKTEYQNPFDTKNQYVNPFDEYKNPFDQLIQQ